MEIDNYRHRILLSAYACEPDKGSEPGVGWNWAIHLTEKYEVYVITRLNNKDIIEQYLAENPIEHVHFYYHDCSNIAKRLKKLPNGIFLYYKKWQKEVFPIVKKITQEECIELVHHVTFNEFRTPGKLYKLDMPFVWGPIGGGQFYNPIFRKAYFSKKDIAKELLRNGINHLHLAFSLDIKNVVNKAKAILIADQSTERIMPQGRSYVRLLETAYNLDRNPLKNYTVKKVGEEINLIWVGGIWPRKGLKILIDSLGKSNFRNFNLKIIGDGEDKKKCQDLVRHYDLEKYVHFYGKMTYQEVNQQYDNADVFVFTSLRDTSGNVVLEAMSHGLPVITLDHHGAGEMVTDETGIKIVLESYEQVLNDIIKAIRFYADNPLMIEKHGRAARRRVEQVYSWQHNTETMCKVYDEILGDMNKRTGES